MPKRTALHKVYDNRRGKKPPPPSTRILVELYSNYQRNALSPTRSTPEDNDRVLATLGFIRVMAHVSGFPQWKIIEMCLNYGIRQMMIDYEDVLSADLKRMKEQLDRYEQALGIEGSHEMLEYRKAIGDIHAEEFVERWRARPLVSKKSKTS